jgi:phosphate transport system substrate-binding protein
VLLPTNPTNTAKSAAVVKFFDWALTKGDAAARELQYIPLPETVKASVRASWKSVKN